MHFLDIPAVQLGPEFIKMAVRGSEPSISPVTGRGVSLCLPDSNLGDRNLVANLGTSCPRPASQGGAGQFWGIEVVLGARSCRRRWGSPSPVLTAQGRRPGQGARRAEHQQGERAVPFIAIICSCPMSLQIYVSGFENNCEQNRLLFHLLKTERERNRRFNSSVSKCLTHCKTTSISTTKGQLSCFSFHDLFHS